MIFFEKIFFGILLLSILTIFDLLIKFKRPYVLKIFFLLIILSIGASSYIHSIDLDSTDYVYVLIFVKAIIASSFLNIFSILYFPKFRVWVLILSVILLMFTTYSLIYNDQYNPAYKISLKTQTLLIVNDEKLLLPIPFRILRILIIASFFGTFLYFLYNIINIFKFNNIYFDKIKKWTVSIFILILFILLLYLPLPFLKNTIIGYGLTSGVYIYIIMLIFYRPSFLNKSSMKISFGNSFSKESDFEVNEFEFINIFYTNFYFTDNEASLDSLAKKLNVSSNELYKFIYYKYSMTFNDLLNKNRVDFFTDLINNPKYLNFTIDALAKEAGFSSRQHLYKPFKKFHGGNPSDLIDAKSI
jgi:AraC-like DNA-binding protein